MQHTMVLTPAMEDYLEAMLSLEETEGVIRVTDVAEKMQVAKPTVSQTATRLKKLGMVEQASYGAIHFTEKGRAYAARVHCRHQLLYNFLVNYVGIDAITAEGEACLMEHVLSRETMAKFNALMIKIDGWTADKAAKLDE